MAEEQQAQRETSAHGSGTADTSGTSGASGRRRLRWGTLLALVAWTIILYIGSAGTLQQILQANSVAYNHYGAVRTQGHALSLALAVLGIVMYIAPVVLGALARTWLGALAFTLIPLWLIRLPAAISFAGYVPGPLVYGAGPVQPAPLGVPFWMDTTHALVYIVSSAVFVILTTTGWVARRAWTHELFIAR